MSIFRRPYNVMERRLEESDLPNCKGGWDVVGPHFVGVGVPKAGTSWWYEMLLHHPQVVAHRLFNEASAVSKELNFFLHYRFQHLTEVDKELYRQCFAAPEGCITGEWSTAYFSNPISIRALADTVPQTRVMVLLRNPVDRALSHINHLKQNRQKLLKIDAKHSHLFEIYSIIPEAMHCSKYADGLKNVLKYFSSEQFLVLQYEKCVADPRSEYLRTLEFLDLPPCDDLPEFKTRVNWQPYVSTDGHGDEREVLSECFRDDVALCKKLIPQLEIEYWKDF